MGARGITFLSETPRLAVDPNRMDIAMFVGFLPLRAGEPGRRARERALEQLKGTAWERRAEAADSDLTDIPIRVKSIEDVEAMFDTGGRLTRRVELRGRPLPGTVEIGAEDAVFGLSLDGAEAAPVSLAGPLQRDALAATLDAIPGLSVGVGEDVDGAAPLIFRRSDPGPGSLTIYRNPSLGFDDMAFDRSLAIGAPMGVALRSFFAEGGREAVIVRLGAPCAHFAPEAERVEALKALVGGEFGDDQVTLASLAGKAPDGLPGDDPAGLAWSGLANLRGCDDVSFVLLPDIADLVSTVQAAAPETEALKRPRETFRECDEAAKPIVMGQFLTAVPASADAIGLAVWKTLVAWAADQVKAITPEAMVIACPPLYLVGPDGGAGPRRPVTPVGPILAPRTFDRPQLQIVSPWLRSRHARDLPGSAAPADGFLAGRIARTTLESGAWRSVAGQPLGAGTVPFGASGPGGGDVESCTTLAYGSRGTEIRSDLTTQWQVRENDFRQAHLRRLMALVLRAARHRGQASVFEPNGERFWANVAMTMRTLLRQLRSEGALRGAREEESFSVVCGRETMSQADIDAGRAIVEISFAPAHSVEEIEVSLIAGDGRLVEREGAP